MSNWNEFKKEHYQQKYSITYGQGMIDFAPESMDDVRGGSFKSYDEYLEVQRNSCGQARRYFELAYYAPAMDMHFRGTIDRVDAEKAKIVFKRIAISGIYRDGIGFYGKEDHVWMNLAGFETFQAGDSVEFFADVYRYMRHGKGKLIDYALENPSDIKKIDAYQVPTDQDLVDQQIRQLVCETCRYYDQCFLGNCVADPDEVQKRIDLLKSFQPGKFTPFTVMLAYELEYRFMGKNGTINIKENDPHKNEMIRLVEICNSQPVYYSGNPQEALMRMISPEKPRIYIE